MTTLINHWFKQLFTHQASDVGLKSNSSNRSFDKTIDRNCLFGETITDRCIIVDKPSTMSDADAMHCDDEQQQQQEEKSSKFFFKNLTEKNTIVIDKFQACFIDCTCQCEARKVIPQINTTECKDIKSQLFEQLFNQTRQSSYEIECCCDCGKKGMRKLKFNYATGDKSAKCD